MGIYEYRVSENTKYYSAQQSILQESSLSMWVGRQTDSSPLPQMGLQMSFKQPTPFTLRDVMYVLQH